MTDDFASLYAFNRWANSKMLDAGRKLSPEQYAAEPIQQPETDLVYWAFEQLPQKA